MPKRWRRPNKALQDWGADITRREIQEAFAADRQRDEMNTYPMNQFAVAAAIMFVVIVVIGLLYAIGVVKP